MELPPEIKTKRDALRWLVENDEEFYTQFRIIHFKVTTSIDWDAPLWYKVSSMFNNAVKNISGRYPSLTVKTRWNPLTEPTYKIFGEFDTYDGNT